LRVDSDGRLEHKKDHARDHGCDSHANGLLAISRIRARRIGSRRHTVENLHYRRLPWWHLWRVADKVGVAAP
jgi:hypothetical protein